MSMKRSSARTAATLAIAGLAVTAAAIPAQAAAPATVTTLAAATAASSSTGGPITRSEVIERAKYWLGKNLTYNQGGSYPDSDGKYYRTDCSGYVSMAWHLTSSLNTVGIGDSADTYEIPRSQLKAGDVLNSYYDHIILFDKWDDAAHTKFSYYTFGSTPVKHITGMSINASTIDGHPNGDYKALRYDNIVDDTQPTTAGAYRPGESVFYVSNQAGGLEGYAGFGASGDVPVAGDWNADGQDTFGVYRPSNQTFYLTNNNSSVAVTRKLGNPDDVPVVGDWDGNGTDTIGIYRPSDQTFYLTNDNASISVTRKMGVAGDTPMTGDWDGNGTDTVGIYRPGDQTFYLSDSNATATVNHTVKFGNPGDTPIKGDWNGDGTDKVGIYRTATSDFIGAAKDSNTVVYNKRFGNPGDIPITGAW